MWGNPSTLLDDMVKIQILILPGLELWPLFIQPIESHYNDYAPAVYNES
jgi:hypothetical protein